MWRLFGLAFCWPVFYSDPPPSPLVFYFCMCVFEEHGCGGGSSVTGEGVLSHGAVDRQETDEPCRCRAVKTKKNLRGSIFFSAGRGLGKFIYIQTVYIYIYIYMKINLYFVY